MGSWIVPGCVALLLLVGCAPAEPEPPVLPVRLRLPPERLFVPMTREEAVRSTRDLAEAREQPYRVAYSASLGSLDLGNGVSCPTFGGNLPYNPDPESGGICWYNDDPFKIFNPWFVGDGGPDGPGGGGSGGGGSGGGGAGGDGGGGSGGDGEAESCPGPAEGVYTVWELREVCTFGRSGRLVEVDDQTYRCVPSDENSDELAHICSEVTVQGCAYEWPVYTCEFDEV